MKVIEQLPINLHNRYYKKYKGKFVLNKVNKQVYRIVSMFRTVSTYHVQNVLTENVCMRYWVVPFNVGMDLNNFRNTRRYNWNLVELGGLSIDFNSRNGTISHIHCRNEGNIKYTALDFVIIEPSDTMEALYG